MMQRSAREDVSAVVNQHRSTVHELLNKFIEKHKDVISKAVAADIRLDWRDPVWRVMPMDGDQEEQKILEVHFGHPFPYTLHLHVPSELEGVHGTLFRELAESIYAATGMEVYVYPPPLTIMGREFAVVNENFEPDAFNFSSTAVAGSLAISTVALTQLLGRSDYTTVLYIALWFFAISVPLLAVRVLFSIFMGFSKVIVLERFNLPANLGGLFATYMGVTFLFFHFHWLIGATFVFVSLISLVQAVYNTDAVRRLKEYGFRIGRRQ